MVVFLFPVRLWEENVFDILSHYKFVFWHFDGLARLLEGPIGSGCLNSVVVDVLCHKFGLWLLLHGLPGDIRHHDRRLCDLRVPLDFSRHCRLLVAVAEDLARICVRRSDWCMSLISAGVVGVEPRALLGLFQVTIGVKGKAWDFRGILN